MKVFYCVPFTDYEDFNNVIDGFEMLDTPFGIVNIEGCYIRSFSEFPRFEIKFVFNCNPADAWRVKNYLNSYLVNLLGELY